MLCRPRSLSSFVLVLAAIDGSNWKLMLSKCNCTGLLLILFFRTLHVHAMFSSYGTFLYCSLTRSKTINSCKYIVLDAPAARGPCQDEVQTYSGSCSDNPGVTITYNTGDVYDCLKVAVADPRLCFIHSYVKANCKRSCMDFGLYTGRWSTGLNVQSAISI